MAILLKEKFEIELEPNSHSGGRMPDLKIESESSPVFIECKTINTKKFYMLEEKKQIAQKIRSILHTPNQLTVFFDNLMGIENLFKKLNSTSFVNQIVTAKKELNIFTEDGVQLNVIPRKTSSDPNFSGYIQMIMEDNASEERKPGFVFMKKGQSTGIFGPLVDFNSCLEKKRGKSRTQCVGGFPYILSIDASNILGDPKQNLSYIKGWFQPKINTRYSGILLCKTFSREFNSCSTEIEFLKNVHSRNSIDGKLEKFLLKMGKQKFDHLS